MKIIYWIVYIIMISLIFFGGLWIEEKIDKEFINFRWWFLLYIIFFCVIVPMYLKYNLGIL